MSKSITKKALTLFFAFILLTQFGVSKPMFKKFFSCCFPVSTNYQQPAEITKTNHLNKLPYDCLYEIFKFLGGIDLCGLKYVCKDFENVIKKYSFFSTIVNGKECVVWLPSEQAAKRFVRESFLPKVNKKDVTIFMDLGGEKTYVKFLPKWLKSLKPLLCNNDNRLVRLEVINAKRPEGSINILFSPLEHGGIIKSVQFNKSNISPKELEMFRSVKFLEIIGSENKKLEFFEGSGGQEIFIRDAPNLRFVIISKKSEKSMLLSLRVGNGKDYSLHLFINDCKTFNDCNNFNGKILGKVGCLKELWVNNCKIRFLKCATGLKFLAMSGCDITS